MDENLERWEKKILERPGAAERVAEIEDEMRLAAKLCPVCHTAHPITAACTQDYQVVPTPSWSQLMATNDRLRVRLATLEDAIADESWMGEGTEDGIVSVELVRQWLETLVQGRDE